LFSFRCYLSTVPLNGWCSSLFAFVSVLVCCWEELVFILSVGLCEIVSH
jgi:hypothetical protein